VKLFRTSHIDTVQIYKLHFSFDLSSTVIAKLNTKFKYIGPTNCSNLYCSYSRIWNAGFISAYII